MRTAGHDSGASLCLVRTCHCLFSCRSGPPCARTWAISFGALGPLASTLTENWLMPGLGWSRDSPLL
eukprot:9559985-Lingulodinium_polyedra.AAC.1